MNMRAVLGGSAVGVLLSLLSMMLLNIPDATMLTACGLLVLLFSAYVTSSARAGALFGLFVIISGSVVEFAYLVFVSGVVVSLVPYAVGFVLFVGRIPVFLLLGAIGGYLGQEYFADKGKPRARRKRNRLRS
jgi:hypothetical protein